MPVQLLRDLLSSSSVFPLLLPRLPLFIKMWTSRAFFASIHLFGLTHAISGFPPSGNGLWYSKPGISWSRELLPVGNGYLAAMIPGGTMQETTQLNIESLWSGGPFADPAYNGGNKQPDERSAMAQAMQNIRQTIFRNTTGDIDNIEVLATDAGQYGSYAGAGYLVSNINSTGPVTNYSRWLDLDDGVARTTWTQAGARYLRTTFCSHPTQACTEHIITTTPSASLPSLSYAFSSDLEHNLPAPNVTCLTSSSLLVRGFVSVPPNPPSMLYSFVFRVSASAASSSVRCVQLPVSSGLPPNATIEITSADNSTGFKEAHVTWVGSTDYSMDAGDTVHNFAFRGADPHSSLLALLSLSQTSSSVQPILDQHIRDYKATLTKPFCLSFSSSTLSSQNPADTPTNILLSQYAIDAGGKANVYLEWVMFNYGRYLLASSARGILPANLQGKWADGISNAWSADYHSNINIQMNYWIAETTNLDVTQSLFDFLQKTLAPRGAETAKILYNITRGWVTHNEMNIFGHTGMKASGNSAQWANYPESAVWMMIHVWDHFDYTNDVAWWKSQGWPLMKGVASFHLNKLIPDLYFNDSTLLVSPCNSPEQTPITFGCAHAQQMIWQLLNAIEKGFAASEDTDTAFLDEVRAKRETMDKGLRIGSWGQLQEWKVEKDSPTDTHRHLSHLIGLYPGYAITSYDASLQGGLSVNGEQTTYTKDEVLSAARVSLFHRGNGTGPDADSGWEKVWRAAAWAQLGDSDKFYHELSFAISENFGANLFSLYDPSDSESIFQIDANLGYSAAVMNALIQAPDVPTLVTPLIITLLPALPKQWDTGSIRGARVRGGICINLYWSEGRPKRASFAVDAHIISRPVKMVYAGKVLLSFTTSSGLKGAITDF